LSEKACFDKRNYHSLPARYSWYSVAWGRRLMFWHPPQGARRRAVRRRHPSSWSRCRSGEVPDRSARCLKKGGFARHVPSLCFTEIDLHEMSGGVPDTDPHPRKKKRIKEQRSKATVRAPRRSHTVRPVLQSMGKLFAAPSTNPAANATAVSTALHRGGDTAS